VWAKRGPDDESDGAALAWCLWAWLGCARSAIVGRTQRVQYGSKYEQRPPGGSPTRWSPPQSAQEFEGRPAERAADRPRGVGLSERDKGARRGEQEWGQGDAGGGGIWPGRRALSSLMRMRLVKMQ